MGNKTARTVEERLTRLERAIFGTNRKQTPKTSADAENFTGATGGVRLLISRNFFKTKRTLADVRAELEKNDYHYVGQVIQTALNRQARRNGPLGSFTETGKKMYVKRK